MKLIAVIFLTILLTGCAGIEARYTTRIRTCEKLCMMENGIDGHFLYFKEEYASEINDEESITKENLIKYWGKPDNIITNNSLETWIYHEKRWVGFMPIMIIPLPLFLPLGKDEAFITFKDGRFLKYSEENYLYEQHLCTIGMLMSPAKSKICGSDVTASKIEIEK